MAPHGLANHQRKESTSMATTKYVMSRKDVESLVERLENRATTPLLDDMPSLQQDLKITARLLRFMVNHGMPTSPITIEVDNGK